ncbi:unnamed protein product [Arctia plantaginis]|uniref:Ig-like domain-containing protein n=1 Tax=Arctia plantaginis TaxID=874455 RepID=A0A8S0ZS21_ARCPL|nr:unnamed protein product [Arctia plantaginis]
MVKQIRKKNLSFFLINFISLTCKSVFSRQWKPFELTVCYGKSSKSANSTNDTNVIDVIEGSSVQLWCHYCNTKEDYNPKLWFYRPRGMMKQTMQEIETRDDVVDKNMSITLSHILSLNYFRPNYSGVYTCKRYDNGHKSKFTYVLEGVLYVEVSPKVGTYTQWQEYKRMYIDPVNKKFKVSQEEPFKSFRKQYNTIVKVYTVWDNWSECQAIDVHLKGKRKRLGKCRICPVNNTIKSTHKAIPNNIVNSYLADAYDVPCRSIKLNEALPEISRIVRNIPEFEAEEICSMPRKTENKTGNGNSKHKTTQQVMEDSHVTLMCNEVNPNSDLKWFKDKKMLKSLYGNIFNRREDEPHISIDASNSLHILHISKNEEGNYTCSINGKKVKQFEVKEVQSLNKRCNRCRSRGDNGTCKDPFPLNVTEADAEVGLHIVACPSGWCGKLIEGTIGAFRQDDYGTATERMCLQRPPSDYEERCAYTMWNRKKVYMCFCNGDLCNAAGGVSSYPLLLTLAVLCPVYNYLI